MSHSSVELYDLNKGESLNNQYDILLGDIYSSYDCDNDTVTVIDGDYERQYNVNEFINEVCEWCCDLDTNDIMNFINFF